MIIIQNFLVAFFFSFIGTIPPGTLNLTILQLGLENKIGLAWRFAIAAALVEYPYAWLAVKFAEFIAASSYMVDNIQLVTAIVMIALGLFTLWSARYPTKFTEKFSSSGFRRGLVLSLLNPLALPFWLGTTAYLHGQYWIYLNTDLRLHGYLAGVSIGALALFMSLAYLAKRVVSQIQNSQLLKIIPGIILVILGIYAFIQYLR